MAAMSVAILELLSVEICLQCSLGLVVSAIMKDTNDMCASSLRRRDCF